MTPKTKSCGKRCAWRRIDGPYGTRCGGPVRGILDQFPATSPSVGYLFGQETVAGATSDGRSAPVADPGGPNVAGSSRPTSDIHGSCHSITTSAIERTTGERR